jgi:hypothetical protein
VFKNPLYNVVQGPPHATGGHHRHACAASTTFAAQRSQLGRPSTDSASTGRPSRRGWASTSPSGGIGLVTDWGWRALRTSPTAQTVVNCCGKCSQDRSGLRQTREPYRFEGEAEIGRLLAAMIDLATFDECPWASQIVSEIERSLPVCPHPRTSESIHFSCGQADLGDACGRWSAALRLGFRSTRGVPLV